MKLLAIDYGTKRIGLAMSVMGIVMPYKMLDNFDQKKVIEELTTIVEEEMIQTIVVGIPISTNNQTSQTLKIVYEFIDALKKTLQNIPIVCQDESYSTKSAISNYKDAGYKGSKIKKIKDMGSACNILSKYLSQNEFS